MGSLTQRINLVSPPFSCGVAWLANLLLALDVRASNAGFPDHWQECGTSSCITEAPLAHLKWHLPILHDRTEFHFREKINVVWEHRLDFAREAACPTILFVRDPRDAIHSLYRRQYETHYSFPEYLARPDIWQDHFPELFRLPPLETYAYFVTFWMAMAARAPLLIVRFEDSKSQPIETVGKVLAFLGVSRTRQEIDHALKSSSFDSARRAMEAMTQATGKDFRTARRGQPGEWKESYDKTSLAFVAGPVVEVMAHLGYVDTKDTLPDAETGVFRPDIETLLAQHFDQSATAAAREAVAACLAEEPLPLPTIVQAIADDTTQDGPMRHAFAALVLAAYYVDQIFGGMDAEAIPAKRLGLAAFLGLHLRHMPHPPIRSVVRTMLHDLKQQPLSPQ